ncbi:hypothetical protein [Variovorax sp. LT1R16]|uniref:hypothetical protein n=1 Tax=Variovorax sp. LT1R16 TaxID=3443728 RepID=UPI003F45ED65
MSQGHPERDYRLAPLSRNLQRMPPGNACFALSSSTSTPNVPAAESMTRSTVLMREEIARVNGFSGITTTA